MRALATILAVWFLAACGQELKKGDEQVVPEVCNLQVTFPTTSWDVDLEEHYYFYAKVRNFGEEARRLTIEVVDLNEPESDGDADVSVGENLYMVEVVSTPIEEEAISGNLAQPKRFEHLHITAGSWIRVTVEKKNGIFEWEHCERAYIQLAEVD